MDVRARWYAAAGAVLLGYAAEWVGIRTGFPFGEYRYTDVLWPQLGGVPVIVALAWGGMGLAACLRTRNQSAPEPLTRRQARIGIIGDAYRPGPRLSLIGMHDAEPDGGRRWAGRVPRPAHRRRFRWRRS
ncbi:hypothetical protein Sru01_69880 [Sphaerisporangium rufum]|uniref:Uncharacterized protein n=1 Tax=Sphaerisporangium rufum TaxID=1381558 RepID=A0A919RBL3_9ACTN|nr:carotenoid biosynthesis protein [Sphaerisporangium rufum]GII82006.1 hypothetical protein Sru01_69880 [Sphaerisporangium rufum]